MSLRIPTTKGMGNHGAKNSIIEVKVTHWEKSFKGASTVSSCPVGSRCLGVKSSDTLPYYLNSYHPRCQVRDARSLVISPKMCKGSVAKR